MLLLINPNSFHGYRFPSLGLLYIASFLTQKGIEINYFDCNYDKHWQENLINKLSTSNFSNIGITCNILTIKPVLDLCNIIRTNSPNSRIILGGPYPTIEFKKFLQAPISGQWSVVTDSSFLGSSSSSSSSSLNNSKNSSLITHHSPLITQSAVDNHQITKLSNLQISQSLSSYADVVVIGEGEVTMFDIVLNKKFEDTDGIAYKTETANYKLQNANCKKNTSETIYNSSLNEDIVKNKPRVLIQNLDELPIPAWHLGEPKKYILPHTKKNPVLPIMTSRGCPFNCIFCGSAIIHKQKLRYRSIEKVIDEIETLHTKYSAQEVHIWDDNFTLDTERVFNFCDALIKSGLHQKLAFSIPAGIKPDTGDISLFSKMRKAGFYAVCMAIETGSQEIMTKLGKKVDLSKVNYVIKSAKKAGLFINAFFMLGLPYDTVESMEKTIKFATSIPIDQVLFFITIPFPGTKLYDIVKQHGKFLFRSAENYWENGYFMGKAAYETENFSAMALEKIYRKAYRRFYLRPSHIWKLFLLRVKKPFDLFWVIYKGIKVIFRGRQF